MTHDKPKELLDDDIFRRRQFSLRIASMIRTRIQSESIVIGINGPWGQGKTSVLNFVTNDLKQDSEKIIVMKFNPWLFKEEEGLLKTFFQSVTEALSAALKKQELEQGMARDQLREDLKQLANIISEYSAGAISELPGAWLWKKPLKGLVRWLTTTELETRKKRLGDLVGKYQRKVVVVIDDIDRLSKDEIYTIFRLVKLTADFDHFIYLMAYDNERVAEAIGSRFGDDEEAGRHFLDKIVQVPLSLPLILKDDLTILFRTTLFKLLDSYNIALEREELKRLVDLYDIAFVNQIDSPRKVVRYLNAIEFSLPIMMEETNIVDLILIEGMKVFYPEHYEFIRMNEKILTNWSNKDHKECKEELDTVYDRFIDSASETVTVGGDAILVNLFPVAQYAWNNVPLSAELLGQMTLQKRIGTIEYFNRYFTLALTPFDISEKTFKELLNAVAEQPIDKTAKLVENLQIESLIMKLRHVERDLTESQSFALVNLLTNLSNKINNGSVFSFEDSAPLSQGAILISNLIKNIKDNAQRYELLTMVVMKSPSIVFAAETIRWIDHSSNSEPVLATDNLFSLRRQLRMRVLGESYNKPFYVAYPDLARDIIAEWGVTNKEQLYRYVNSEVKGLPSAIDFLASVADRRFSASRGLFISDLDESDYKLIANSVGVNWIYDILLQTVDEAFSQDVRVKTQPGEQNGENLIKQFMLWHQKTLGPKWEMQHLNQRLNKAEDITKKKITLEVAKDMMRDDIIPLLKEIESNALELMSAFNEYDRDIRLDTGGNGVLVANKQTSWEDVENQIAKSLQKTNRFSLQSLEYDLLLRGYKKSATTQYMRTSLKFQFNEYTYSITLNHNTSEQRNFTYSDQSNRQKFGSLLADAARQLAGQITSAR